MTFILAVSPYCFTTVVTTLGWYPFSGFEIQFKSIEIFIIIKKIFSHFINVKFNRRRFLEYSLYTAGAALLVDAFWAEQYFIEIQEHNVKSATKDNHDIKIIQISDLHIKSLSSQLEKIIQKINEHHPDLIVFTGDSVDEIDKLSVFDEFLSLLDKDIQKIAILGNWEYWGKINLQKLNEIYKQHNCKLLINERKYFNINNKSICLSGLDDYIGGRPDFDKTFTNYKEADYHIILNHCPGYNDDIIAKAHEIDMGISLILSGHTHGGQINYFGRVPMLPEGSGRYVKGWYKKRGISMYVSKGIGTSIYPIRLGARSEVAVFYL